MNRTKIEWVKNPDGTQGFTSNPIKGYCPVACYYCYSRKDYDRFGWDKSIRFDGKEMAALMRRAKPAGIFVGSMHEIFLDEYISRGWTEEIVEFARIRPQHRIYLLTKQPQNLIKFSPFPDNCWVGVTATNWMTFSNAIGELMRIQAKVKYMSIEPLLAEIKPDMMQQMLMPKVLNQLIIGAQTKPYKPPRIEWTTEIVEAADKARIPVFLKNNLKPLIVDNWNSGKLHNILDHPKTLQTKVLSLRQEMP